MTYPPADGLRVLALLDRLYERHGPQVLGQVLQKLLAAAFAANGHIVIPNAVGVPDFTARRKESTTGFAVEVKTADGPISLSRRDLDGVQNSGHSPVVAVLEYPSADPRWLLLDANDLREGTHEVFRLKRRAKVTIGFDENVAFRTILIQHFDAALESTDALARSLSNLLPAV